MCSVLLSLAITIFIYTLLSDYVIHCQGYSQLQVARINHGHSHQEESSASCSCKSKAFVASAQTGNYCPFTGAAQVDFSDTWTPSFQGSPFLGQNFCCDDFRSCGTMEMPALQEDMLRQTSPLRPMRTTMDRLCRSGLRPDHEEAQQPTGAMDTMVRGQLDTGTMGTIPQTKTISEKAIPAITANYTACKRSWTWQSTRRIAKLWASLIACNAGHRSTVDDFFGISTSLWPQCVNGGSSGDWGQQGGQGARQTNENPGCGIAPQEGRFARRAPNACQRGDSAFRARRDEGIALSRVTARPCKERGVRGSGSAAADARCLAQFSCAVGRPMDQIHLAIHGARKDAHGSSQASPREPPCGKGQLRRMQVSCRGHGKRRGLSDERHRGHRNQGCRSLGWAKNCGWLQRPCHKPAEPTHAGSPGGRARGRTRPAEKAPTHGSHRSSSRHGGCAASLVFWGARVNTSANSIALGLPVQHALGKFFKQAQVHQVHSFDVEIQTNVPDKCVFNPALSWLHSINFEPDFLSPWQAQAVAINLSNELGTVHRIPSCVGFNPNPNQTKVKCPRSLRCAVTFCSDVDLYIGLDDSLHFSHLIVHEDSLVFHDKPWNLHARHSDASYRNSLTPAVTPCSAHREDFATTGFDPGVLCPKACTNQHVPQGHGSYVASHMHTPQKLDVASELHTPEFCHSNPSFTISPASTLDSFLCRPDRSPEVLPFPVVSPRSFGQEPEYHRAIPICNMLESDIDIGVNWDGFFRDFASRLHTSLKHDALPHCPNTMPKASRKQGVDMSHTTYGTPLPPVAM